jgi:GT2 family glycosyltransferase
MRVNKRFSFVIPTYQNKILVRNTLETLNRQEGFSPKDYEVIVVDDGSNDGTGEALESMGKNFEFKYIYLERCPESTRARARNAGIKAAQGDFLVFIDSDMLLKYDYLKELDKYFKYDENIVVIGNRINLTENISYEEILCDNYYENPKFKMDNYSKLEARHLNYQVFSYNAQSQINPWLKVYSCNMAVPKRILDKVGGFDENFKGWGLEDVELGYRLYKNGAKIVISNKIEAFHQKHEKGGDLKISKDRFKEVDRNSYYFIRRHPEALGFPEPVIIKFLRGQVMPNFSAVKGIRKKVVIDFDNEEELENVKERITGLSKQKSLRIIVRDHIETTDLDIWIQLLGTQNSTPLYFPLSKLQEFTGIFGKIGGIGVSAVFVKMNFYSYLVKLYSLVIKIKKATIPME